MHLLPQLFTIQMARYFHQPLLVHYHHHQAWRHLREAARHLSLSKAGAVVEDGVVPDWMLAFEPMLRRALEHRPLIEQLSD